MFGDFDEDEFDDDAPWAPLWPDGSCLDCGAGSDEKCYDDCECDECLGLDDE
jgi:hypothetical protein